MDYLLFKRLLEWSATNEPICSRGLPLHKTSRCLSYPRIELILGLSSDDPCRQRLEPASVRPFKRDFRLINLLLTSRRNMNQVCERLFVPVEEMRNNIKKKKREMRGECLSISRSLSTLCIGSIRSTSDWLDLACSAQGRFSL